VVSVTIHQPRAMAARIAPTRIRSPSCWASTGAGVGTRRGWGRRVSHGPTSSRCTCTCSIRACGPRGKQRRVECEVPRHGVGHVVAVDETVRANGGACVRFSKRCADGRGVGLVEALRAAPATSRNVSISDTAIGQTSGHRLNQRVAKPSNAEGMTNASHRGKLVVDRVRGSRHRRTRPHRRHPPSARAGRRWAGAGRSPTISSRRSRPDRVRAMANPSIRRAWFFCSTRRPDMADHGRARRPAPCPAPSRGHGPGRARCRCERPGARKPLSRPPRRSSASCRNCTRSRERADRASRLIAA
jgi:hypothetical protein